MPLTRSFRSVRNAAATVHRYTSPRALASIGLGNTTQPTQPAPAAPSLNQAVSAAISAGAQTAMVATQGGTGQQIALTIPTLGVSAIGIAAASGVGWATAAIPFVGPIVAGVTLGLGALFSRRSGQQKVAATQIVDEAEPLLAQNRDGYLSNPSPEAQVQALANFDYVWQQISSPEFCGNPALGSAGQRCISERGRGGKWDWFALYRDPIASSVPNPALSPAVSPTATTTPSSNQPGASSSLSPSGSAGGNVGTSSQPSTGLLSGLNAITADPASTILLIAGAGAVIYLINSPGGSRNDD